MEAFTHILLERWQRINYTEQQKTVNSTFLLAHLSFQFLTHYSSCSLPSAPPSPPQHIQPGSLSLTPWRGLPNEMPNSQLGLNLRKTTDGSLGVSTQERCWPRRVGFCSFVWHLFSLFSELPGSGIWCPTLIWGNSQSLLLQIFSVPSSSGFPLDVWCTFAVVWQFLDMLLFFSFVFELWSFLWL